MASRPPPSSRRAVGAPQFDPRLADLVVAHGDEVFEGAGFDQTWHRVISAEPALTSFLTGADLDAALTSVADFVDLKSPYTLGHARGVAELVAGAAPGAGLGQVETTELRRAALVLGFGRLGVSNAIWDKPGPLGAGERERVRLRPYLTERMLQQSAALPRSARWLRRPANDSTDRGTPADSPAVRSRPRAGSSRRPTPTSR